MKRVLCILALLMSVWPLRPASADGDFFKAEPTVVKEWGKLQIYNPLTSPRVVYLLTMKRGDSVFGGEVPLAGFYILEAIAGVGVDVSDSSRSGFVGGNIALPNPLAGIVQFADVRPGLAGGYNLDRKEAFFALKAAVPFGQK